MSRRMASGKYRAPFRVPSLGIPRFRIRILGHQAAESYTPPLLRLCRRTLVLAPAEPHANMAQVLGSDFGPVTSGNGYRREAPPRGCPMQSTPPRFFRTLLREADQGSLCRGAVPEAAITLDLACGIHGSCHADSSDSGPLMREGSVSLPKPGHWCQRESRDTGRSSICIIFDIGERREEDGKREGQR